VQKFWFVSCVTLIFRQIACRSIFQLFFRCRLPLRTRPIHQFSDGVLKLKAERRCITPLDIARPSAKWRKLHR
jgi:hypothetical protein